MSSKKKLISIIIFLIFIIILIFVYNDDFLYSKQIVKITKIDTISEETSQNPLGLEEKYYMRKITGIITNGKQKGKEKTISYDESYSSVVTDKYKVNDKIILNASDIELKRDFYLTLMIVIFLNLLYIVGLLGPMIEIKNTIVLFGNYKKSFVVTLISLIFSLYSEILSYSFITGLTFSNLKKSKIFCLLSSKTLTIFAKYLLSQSL